MKRFVKSRMSAMLGVLLLALPSLADAQGYARVVIDWGGWNGTPTHASVGGKDGYVEIVNRPQGVFLISRRDTLRKDMQVQVFGKDSSGTEVLVPVGSNLVSVTGNRTGDLAQIRLSLQTRDETVMCIAVASVGYAKAAGMIVYCDK